MFRKSLYSLLALLACALILAGIDVARHVLAIQHLEKAGVGLGRWHYRFSGAVTSEAFADAPEGSWRAILLRAIATPLEARFEGVLYRQKSEMNRATSRVISVNP